MSGLNVCSFIFFCIHSSLIFFSQGVFAQAQTSAKSFPSEIYKVYQREMNKIFLELSNESKKSKSAKDFFERVQPAALENFPDRKKLLLQLAKEPTPSLITSKSGIEMQGDQPLKITLTDKVGEVKINGKSARTYLDQILNEKNRGAQFGPRRWFLLPLFHIEYADAWYSIVARGVSIVGPRLVRLLFGESIRAGVVATGAGATIGCSIGIQQREHTDSYAESCVEGAINGAGVGGLAAFRKLNTAVRFLNETGPRSVRLLTSLGFVGGIGAFISGKWNELSNASGSVLRCAASSTFTLSRREGGATRASLVDYHRGTVTFFVPNPAKPEENIAVDVPENIEALRDFFRSRLPQQISGSEDVLAQVFMDELDEMKNTCQQSPGQNFIRGESQIGRPPAAAPGRR
jgi:hypothetical protein